MSGRLLTVIGVVGLGLGAAHAQLPSPQPKAPPVAPMPGQGGEAEERAVDPAPDKALDGLDPESKIDIATQMRIFKQVRKRKEELEREEAQLGREARRLRAIQRDVEDRYKSLRLLQAEMKAVADQPTVPPEERAKQKAEEEAARAVNVRRLSKVFEKMKAAEATQLVEEMDEALAVDVLKLVKGRQAGKIIGGLPPKKAARLTELMAKDK